MSWQHPNSITVTATNIKTGKAETYASLTQCAKALHIGQGNISHVLNNPKYQSAGYRFTRN